MNLENKVRLYTTAAANKDSLEKSLSFLQIQMRILHKREKALGFDSRRPNNKNLLPIPICNYKLFS
jgi:hypothetical protein